MSEFIIPPHNISQPDNPVVFLAGPVQGSYNWQAVAANQLLASPSAMSIISPRGAPELYKKPSAWLDAEQQTPWEKYHLRLARETGVLAMWMAAQNYETPGRAHAQTSRIEFGKIIGWMDYDPTMRFVFGVDQLYNSGNQTYMEQDCKDHSIPIARSLDEWCEQIIQKLPC